MTTTMTKTTLDKNGLQALGGPDWLAAKRLKAFETFEALPFPVATDEAWRRTDPKKVKPDGHQVVAPTTEFGTLGEGSVPAEVTFCSIEEAAEKHADLQKALFSIGSVEEDPFQALNGAFWKGGLYLNVPQDVSTGEVALRAHHKFVGGDKVAAITHSVLYGGKFSKSTVIETFDADNEELLASPMVEIELEEGARMTYVMVHGWGEKTSAVPTIKTRLAKDSQLQMLFVGFGGKLAKVFVDSDLMGEGCKSEVLGLVMGRNKQHYDIDVVQKHIVGGNVSDVLCHVALTDKARSVFSGNVLCEPGAQKIDGYQQNRNLLLSDKARADSMPKLEIEANDVRCTHGATFTTYDANQRFYLESRGLNRFEAERLLVTGFFQEVMDRAGNEALVEHLSEMLERQMEKALGN